MKYAVISDVHANPVALKTALKDARELGCERFLMLGDTTGYGYDAKTAFRQVRAKFDVVLLGNHDSACLGREPAWETAINPHYHQDVRQRSSLSEREIAWLGKRPLLHQEGGAAFVHGSFVRPEEWGYILEESDALRSFDERTERLLFCGHTHAAAVWELTSTGKCREKKLFGRPATKAESKKLKLKKSSRYIVNVGSVGYPRHDLCSTYVIWDDAADCVIYRRLPFDFESYIRVMSKHKVDLPDWLLLLLSDIVRYRHGRKQGILS